MLERYSTVGPLKLARVGASSEASSSRVPLLACGQPGKILSDASLTLPLGAFRGGDFLTAAMTGGPIRPATLQPPVFGAGTPYSGAAGWWAGWNETLQDYRAFGPVHGTGSKRSCNLLFADGSVRSFNDENGDGYLNNGFDPAVAAPLYSGFADAVVELPQELVYSRWSLMPTSRKDQ